MARTKTSANSAVGKVSGKVGKPNPTPDELKTQFYANAKEALKQFVDPNKSTNTTLNMYSREQIRQYLQSPASNQENLRKVARYMYVRSQIMYRLVHWYAGMWDLRCRNVEPTFDLIKGLDKNVLKNYNNTLKQLDVYGLQGNMYEVLVRCYLEDVCYFIWVRNDKGAFPYILDPSECKIIGRYTDTGDLAFAIDMSKYRSQTRRQFIEWFGSPLKEMWAEYERSGLKYIQVPDEYAGCFKFNIEQLDLILPPLAPIMQSLAGMLDLEDYSAVQAYFDVYKMVILPMKALSGAKEPDKFEFTPDLNLEYFDRLVEDALPKYTTAAPVLGDGIEVVDFSNTASDKQVDRVANAQKNLYSISGGGAVLNSTMITSTAAFNAWLAEETEFAISALLPQINGFTNRMLSYDVSKPCKVRHFELSEYTKKDFRDKFLEANQYSFNYRLALGTLYGMSERETLAQMHFEQEVLGLQNLMIYPLKSSFTSSSDGTVDTDPITGGAPKKDDDELSASGERNRNR